VDAGPVHPLLRPALRHRDCRNDGEQLIDRLSTGRDTDHDRRRNGFVRPAEPAVVFGVDEAGKGPVLGPMVAACVVAAPEALPESVDDSKRIAPARRETLAAEIRERAGAVGVARLAPARIDGGPDMNSLTVAAHAEAIDAAGVTGAGIVDAGDVDADRFGRRVEAAAQADVTVDAEHGADASHPSVGAASIVAKVERDAAVATLAEGYDRDIGSGYPSDPTTRTFLRKFVGEHGRLPDCARATWSTCDDVLAAAQQSALDEF
jgi:ribonuclease HII